MGIFSIHEKSRLYMINHKYVDVINGMLTDKEQKLVRRDKQITPKVGEIWRSVGLYRDKPTMAKFRPSIIVDETKSSYIVIEITSQTEKYTDKDIHIPIKHWKECGLDKYSVCRCEKMDSLPKKRRELILYKYGNMDKETFESVVKKYKEQLSGNISPFILEHKYDSFLSNIKLK